MERAGTEIAVKKLYHMSGIDDTQFRNEFNNLMKIQHPNIVRLIGYCYQVHKTHIERKGEFVFSSIIYRVLCFEYLQNGSLDKHLCGTLHFDYRKNYMISSIYLVVSWFAWLCPSGWMQRFGFTYFTKT